MKDLLTSEDYKFGQTINKEYPKISLNELYVLIYDIKHQIEYADTQAKEFKEIRQTELSEFKEKLSSGTIIKNIVINTNKGPLTMFNYGGIYANLFITAKKIIPKYKEYAQNDKKLLKYLAKELPFCIIIRAVNKSSLGPDQKRIVIGMFVDHFRIFKILSKEEFDKSSHIGTWKNYLSDWVLSKLESQRVKSILESISI